MTLSAFAQEHWVYVGTYTGGESRGIYRCRLDVETGALRLDGLATEVANPSFLVLSRDGRRLYAVSESGAGPGGIVTAYACDAGTGALTLLGQAETGGRGPCRVALDERRGRLLVAHYGSGDVSVLPLAEEGGVKSWSGRAQHVGSGPNAKRQEKPHAHSFVPGPDGAYYACDLGIDRVKRYLLGHDDALSPHPAGDLAVPPGSGPRHLVFDPAGRTAYVLNELTATVSVLRRGEADAFSEEQVVSTLPADWTGKRSGAELALLPGGRFLYASNRGHDSVAIFAVREEGRIEGRGHVALPGKTPRHFTLTDDGRFLLAALQDSGLVAVYRVEPESGALTAVGEPAAVPKPTCLALGPILP